MSYIGVGISSLPPESLRELVDRHAAWLDGDRRPLFHGDGFVLFTDSNTAREFVRKCRESFPSGSYLLYTLERLPESGAQRQP